jgi:acetyl-CoA C-acetyltransferase
MLEAYIYDGLRSPFGRQDGALSRVRPDDMLGDVIKAMVARAGFAPGSIDDVNVGCAGQAGEDSRNVARHALLRAGLPIDIPGSTVNRLCGSGMNSIIQAAHAITCGEADVVVSGGVESMTRAPFVVGRTGGAFPKALESYNSSLGARFPNPRIETEFGADTMPATADNLARDFQLKREDCDVFALGSQQKYAAAKAAGFFKDEILGIAVPASKKGAPDTIVAEDEHPRPDTTMEGLAKLRPIFKDGVTTAGNASGINDGAAALLIASKDAGDKAGAKPRARILATGVAGVAPRIMGFGPVPAAKKALERAGLDLKDMDVIEINEAFAAQVLGCCKGLNLAFDDKRINPNGGAIALGHPLGASGSRITLTALRQLERTGGRYALVSMCIGVGQGIAMVIERVK